MVDCNQLGNNKPNGRLVIASYLEGLTESERAEYDQYLRKVTALIDQKDQMMTKEFYEEMKQGCYLDWS